MKILKKSYNVLTMESEVAITSNTPVVVGTNDEYKMIKAASSKSGILRLKATVDDFPVFGTFSVNPWAQEDKLECSCLTNVGFEPKGCFVTLEPSNDGMKCTVIFSDLT